MASAMQQIVRPKLARPVATWREDMITMGIAFWPITAMVFDGRNHTGQESFFTLTHCILYLGLTVLAGWIGLLVSRYHQTTGMIPLGYGVAAIGLCVLAIGGPSYLAWHPRYGFDAIYSPPRLMLLFGTLLVSSTGLRSTWARWGDAPDWRAFGPALLSAILFIGVAGAGLTGYGDNRWPYSFYSAGHSMDAEIVTTLVLLGPTLLLLRRWRVPFGAITVTFGGFGLLVSVLTEYRDAALILPLLVAGATVDLAQRRLAQGPKERVTPGGIRLIGPIAAAALWLSYYGVLSIDKGIGWGGSLVVGALIMGTLTGFGVAFLIAPPPYGPATGAVAPTGDVDSLRM